MLVVGAQGRQQVEAGDAERMDHAVRAAGEHHVGVAAADDLDRLADRLAAGGAGRQAVGVRALGVEHGRQVAGRHVGLLLQFDRRVQPFQAGLGEQRPGRTARPPRRAGHHAGEAVEILLPLAAAQIDAEPGRVELAATPGCPSRAPLSWPRRRRTWCAGRGTSRPRGSSPTSADVPIADFGRDLGGKVAGVEDRRIADARRPALQALPHLLHVGRPSA